jgi:hypothetical protein
MPSLTDILKTHSPAGDDAAVAAWLADPVTVDSGDGRVTYADLAVRFGADAVTRADNVLAGIPERQWARAALAGAGLDLGTHRAKLELESLRPYLGDELTDGLLALGTQSVPRWQALGLAAEPAAAAVAAARPNLAIDSFPLSAVLLSVNVRPGGRAAVSLRVTPAAVGANGDEVAGEPFVASFSGDPQSLPAARRQLLAAVLAAVEAFRGA